MLTLIPVYIVDVLFIQNRLTQKNNDQKRINYFFETLIYSSLVTVLLGLLFIKPTIISMIELAQFIIGSILVGFIVENIEHINIDVKSKDLNYNSTDDKKSNNSIISNRLKRINFALVAYGICLSLLFFSYLSLSSLKDKINNSTYEPTINQFETFVHNNSKKNLRIYKKILDDELKNTKTQKYSKK